jgi:hypothetical protein
MADRLGKVERCTAVRPQRRERDDEQDLSLELVEVFAFRRPDRARLDLRRHR